MVVSRPLRVCRLATELSRKIAEQAPTPTVGTDNAGNAHGYVTVAIGYAVPHRRDVSERSRHE
jgi:hypothetical protein